MPHFATYVMCWVEKKKQSLNVKALKWLMWDFYFPLKKMFFFPPLSTVFVSSATVRLAGPGPGAVLAGGLFAACRLSWQWSVVAEVFALNNLFVGLLLALTASFHRAESAEQRTRVRRQAVRTLL